MLPRNTPGRSQRRVQRRSQRHVERRSQGHVQRQSQRHVQRRRLGGGDSLSPQASLAGEDGARGRRYGGASCRWAAARSPFSGVAAGAGRRRQAQAGARTLGARQTLVGWPAQCAIAGHEALLCILHRRRRARRVRRQLAVARADWLLRRWRTEFACLPVGRVRSASALLCTCLAATQKCAHRGSEPSRTVQPA